MAALTLPEMNKGGFISKVAYSASGTHRFLHGGGGIYKEGHFILYNIAVTNCPVTHFPA